MSVDAHFVKEVVEPLEETRSELIFATEPLLSSLYLSIPGAPHHTPLVDLDEVEVRVLPFLPSLLHHITEPMSKELNVGVNGECRYRKASSNYAKASRSYIPPHGLSTLISLLRVFSSITPYVASPLLPPPSPPLLLLPLLPLPLLPPIH